jgi:hypothetical protein
MNVRGLRQPKLPSSLQDEALPQVINGGALNPRVIVPDPPSRGLAVALQMTIQVLELDWHAFLGPHEIGLLLQDRPYHSLFPIGPTLRAVLWIVESEIEGHHLQGEGPWR